MFYLCYTENQGLVSKIESEDSNVTVEEAKQFVSEEQVQEEAEATPGDNDDADDLVWETICFSPIHPCPNLMMM